MYNNDRRQNQLQIKYLIMIIIESVYSTRRDDLDTPCIDVITYFRYALRELRIASFASGSMYTKHYSQSISCATHAHAKCKIKFAKLVTDPKIMKSHYLLTCKTYRKYSTF